MSLNPKDIKEELGAYNVSLVGGRVGNIEIENPAWTIETWYERNSPGIVFYRIFKEGQTFAWKQSGVEEKNFLREMRKLLEKEKV